MFLTANKRIKDVKIHFYWTLVESVRVFQRQVLYLVSPSLSLRRHTAV